MSPTKHWRLLFILTHWSYSKCKDILKTLNVYQISSKEHHLGDCSAAHEISLS